MTGIKDYFLYVLISLAVVLSAVGFSVYSPSGTQFPVRWIWLVCSAAIVFGYTIKVCKQGRKKAKFWVILAVLLLLHIGLFIVLFARLKEISLLLLAASVGPEVFLILLCVDKLGIGQTGE